MSPAVAVFAKAPIPGHAKTRLGAGLGMVRAARVYEAMLLSLLDRLRASPPGWRRFLFAAEPRDLDWFKEHILEWELVGQQGDDLGRRLEHTFDLLFARSIERAVIVGADAPDLDAGHLLEAGAALLDHELVLGPAHDGGYYLIGQRAPGAALFDDVPWSTARVFNHTLERAGDLELKVHTLPELGDIDTLDDWLHYRG